MWYLWTGITIYVFLLVLGRVHCPTAVDHILALVTITTFVLKNILKIGLITSI